jgi:hypothetical protein
MAWRETPESIVKRTVDAGPGAGVAGAEGPVAPDEPPPQAPSDRARSAAGAVGRARRMDASYFSAARAAS